MELRQVSPTCSAYLFRLLGPVVAEERSRFGGVSAHRNAMHVRTVAPHEACHDRKHVRRPWRALALECWKVGIDKVDELSDRARLMSIYAVVHYWLLNKK
jgi:hypothetical protein